MSSEVIVPVSRHQTHFLLFGVSTIKNLLELSELILFIPGNPGICDFYEDFLLKLYQLSSIPIVAASHLCQHRKALPGYHSHNLDEQVEHKIDFLKQYVASSSCITIIGHSIGCHIALEVMDRLYEAMNIKKLILLMPTLEKMAVSPRGKETASLIKYHKFFAFLHAIFTTLLPDFLLVKLICKKEGCQTPAFIRGVQSIIKTRIFYNVLYMASTEMQQIVDLDVDLLSRSIDKTSMFFTDIDHWAPEAHYWNVLKMFPNADVVLNREGISHQFVDFFFSKNGIYSF